MKREGHKVSRAQFEKNIGDSCMTRSLPQISAPCSRRDSPWEIKKAAPVVSITTHGTAAGRSVEGGLKDNAEHHDFPPRRVSFPEDRRSIPNLQLRLPVVCNVNDLGSAKYLSDTLGKKTVATEKYLGVCVKRRQRLQKPDRRIRCFGPPRRPAPRHCQDTLGLTKAYLKKRAGTNPGKLLFQKTLTSAAVGYAAGTRNRRVFGCQKREARPDNKQTGILEPSRSPLCTSTLLP